MRRVLFRAAILTVLLASLPAQAKVFEVTAGMKFGAGVELWSEPSGTRIQYTDKNRELQNFEIPFFDETRSGYNYSVGLFAEFRFWQYVGLEIGLNMMRHTMFEDTDWSYTEIRDGVPSTFTATSEQELSFTSFHIPILIKGVLPIRDVVRLSLMIGPEIAVGSYAFAKFEITETSPPATTLPGPARSKFAGFGTKVQTDAYLTVGLGVDINAGICRIPIELRYSYNFGQPSDYYKRIEYDTLPQSGDDKDTTHPTTGTYNARDSMFWQMLVGVAYDF